MDQTEKLLIIRKALKEAPIPYKGNDAETDEADTDEAPESD